MSEIKIPNCPCCDGESKLHDYGGGDFRDSGKQYFIKCEKCGLTTKHSSSKDEVLMTWGKRKPIGRIIERLEEEKDYMEVYSWSGARCPDEVEIIKLDKAISVVKEEGGIEW